MIAKQKSSIPAILAILAILGVLQTLEFYMTTVTQSPLTTIAGIGRHDGQPVTIQGWLYNKRESGKLIFPIFRDGTGVIQGVVPKNQVSPEVFETLKNLTDE